MEKRIAGKIAVAVIFPASILLTNVPASNFRLQKPPSVHARTRIKIAETIILNPCGIHSANSENEITRRGR